MRRHLKESLSQNGFSLVELMVGLVIGLLATLVITQTFGVFEGQKRSTSGSSDAQTNGAIALSNIQRDVQVAGYGLPLPIADKNNSTNLFPLVIEDGAGNTSDKIIARFSTTAMGAVPVSIVNAANATASVGAVVVNHIGCNDGDIVLINDGSTCRMTTVADANGNPDSDQNISLSATTPIGAPLVNGAKMACMGNWQNYKYEIVNNLLERNGQPIISEVVNMQAQYGVSPTADSNQVREWVNATGATWAAPTVANRNRIKAIRVAVVVRNGLMEKQDVSTACSSTTAANPTGVCAWDGSVYGAAPVINLSGDANWKKYRYRVFETIIPLRNMLWSKDAMQ